MAKKRRKPKPKPKPKPKKPHKITRKQMDRAGQRLIKEIELLRPVIREAAKTGVAEGIEHCANFWNVSDGYKRYIDHQIASQAEALMAAVRTALREERTKRRRK